LSKTFRERITCKCLDPQIYGGVIASRNSTLHNPIPANLKAENWTAPSYSPEGFAMPILSVSLKPDEASVAAAPLADTVKINTKSVEWFV